MAAGIFSLFGAQPLVISGVTGPITVLNKTIFTIIQGLDNGPDYLEFIGSVLPSLSSALPSSFVASR